MNGVTDGYAEWLYSDDDERPDDERPDDGGEWIGETDIDCPLCDWKLDWRFTHFQCDKCEVTWGNRDEVEHDRNAQSYHMDDDGDRDEPGTWWIGSFNVGGMLG